MSIVEKIRIKHGKSKCLSRYERVGLEKRGRQDGQKGLPKEDINGEWTSPFICEERHSCQEECNKLWGLLQIELEQVYAEIDSLVDQITKSYCEIEMKKGAYLEALNKYDLYIRKVGEEMLSESIVHARRQKEQDRRVAPMKLELTQMEKEMDLAYERLIVLRGVALEKTNATKITTQKIEEHTLQRINSYWNAAYEKCPRKEMMPPIARVDISNSGEQTYRESHRNIEGRMINIIAAREDKTKPNTFMNKEVA